MLLDEAWIAVHAVFGATIADPRIDPELTIAAMARAVDRIVEVASTGAHISLATSQPASLITLSLAFARLARSCGADVADDDDSPALRVDGRAARAIRWVDGVAVVTDGQSLCATRGPEAPQEWLFLVPRPALVVADGPFADVAIDAGIEVIALAGLDHCSLASASAPRPLMSGGADVDRPGSRRVPSAPRRRAPRSRRPNVLIGPWGAATPTVAGPARGVTSHSPR